MEVWKINEWDRLYESAYSRKVAAHLPLKWVQYRVDLNNRAFKRIVQLHNRWDVFGFWGALLELAATCSPRGVLIDRDGIPLDNEDIASMLSAPVELTAESLDMLSGKKIRWVIREKIVNDSDG